MTFLKVWYFEKRNQGLPKAEYLMNIPVQKNLLENYSDDQLKLLIDFPRCSRILERKIKSANR